MPPTPLDDRGLPRGYDFKPDWEVTPRQVKQMLDEDQPVFLVDCREPREYHVAHIPGAQLMPLSELGDHQQTLAQNAERKIVVHCHHGGRSLRAAAMLRQAGFDDVTSMAGGIDLWSQDIDESIPRY